MSEVILSIDPADEGADLTVMCLARNKGGVLEVFNFESYQKLNEVKAAHRALLLVDEHKISARNIVVDAIGVGAGCLNTLASQGVYATRFVGSAAAGSSLPFYVFKNKRAEAGWLLREAFKNRTIRLLEHIERLKNELMATGYFIDNEKTIALPPKREIKRRLGHSPDYFDALCMANYVFAAGQTRSLKALSARPNRVSSIVKGF